MKKNWPTFPYIWQQINELKSCSLKLPQEKMNIFGNRQLQSLLNFHIIIMRKARLIISLDKISAKSYGVNGNVYIFTI